MATHPLADLDAQAELRFCLPDREIDGASCASRGDGYRVVAGLVRRCAYFADGRRQIVSFMFPGELFGFAQGEDAYPLSVEAVIPGTVVAHYPRHAIERLILRDPAVGDQIRVHAFQWMHHMEARLLNLGRMTAAERVGAFLLEVAQRAPTGPERFGLSMSRSDIADYLALSVETVSRMLSRLQRRGAIALPTAHQVQIADRAALAVEV